MFTTWNFPLSSNGIVASGMACSHEKPKNFTFPALCARSNARSAGPR